ncbi:hypothetical protein, partial [Oleiphilus sp. HI0061]|uniref:hypothetical protein n=2 Tax=Oleiphilus sp. HI0061 TaxID=1822239 RepID=UPI000A64F8C6
CLVLCYMWVTNTVFSPSEYKLRHTHFSLLLIFMIISLQLLSANQKSAKLILGTVMFANVVTLVLTIKALMVDHSIARLISESNDVSRMLAAQGLGGYGVVYANVVMLPVFVALYRVLSNQETKHHILIFLTILNFFLCVAFLIKSQYTIANVIAFTGLIVILIRRSLIIFSLMLLGGVAFLASTSFLSDLEVLLNFLDGTRYKEKLLDIIAASSGSHESDGAVGSRSDAYVMSVNTFKENFLFGILAFGKGIGHHSDIVDKFAQWGVFLGGAVVYLLCYYPLYLKRKMKNSISIELGVVLFAMIAIGMLNTITMEVSVPLVMLSCVYVIYRSQALQEVK